MRIKESDIKKIVANINESLGLNPVECATRYIVGSYRFESAYGGHRVVKIVSTCGCINTLPGMSGFDNKRDLYNKIRLFNPVKES